jgi:hypothetical protein
MPIAATVVAARHDVTVVTRARRRIEIADRM